MKADRQMENTMTRRKLSSFLSIVGLSLFAFIIVNIGVWWLAPKFSGSIVKRNLPYILQSTEPVTLTENAPLVDIRDSNCTFHNFSCIEVFHCGYDDNTRISIYIYPIQQYYDENGKDVTPAMSREFEEILRIIHDSSYFTSNPETACIFVPSVDLLNQNLIDPIIISKILASLKW